MKRLYIDNSLLSDLCKDSQGTLWNGFLDITNECYLDIEDRKISLQNDWGLFLEFIGLGNVLRKLCFDFDSETMKTLTSFLESTPAWNINQLNKLLDDIFTKCLSECHSLVSIQPSNLISKYNEQCKYYRGAGSGILLPIIADRYAKCLTSDPQDSLSTLTKYLAWHRQCAYYNSAFNQLITKGKEPRVWDLFQQLMATFYWIASDHKIQLPWFRLINTTYLLTTSYDKNDCNSEQRKWFEKYTHQHKLKGNEDLADCSYIDAATIGKIDIVDEEIIQNPVVVFTKDNPDQVRSRLQISRNFLEKLQTEVEGWSITPSYGGEVICVKRTNGSVSLVEKIKHCVSL